MSDVSRVGESAEAMPASSVAAAENMRSVVRTGLTETDSGIGAIADDEEKVSAAGILISQASTGTDVRFEKVNALRNAIDAGTYAVPAEQVAQKLMNGMLKS